MIFDTHAHYYDDAFDADRDELLTSLPGRGVELVVCPGCDLESSRASLALAERYSYIYAAAGFHPENLEGASLADLEQVKALCAHPRAVTAMHKPCYGKCPRCVWRWNGGCSEWQG